jgi:hypothetical protein
LIEPRSIFAATTRGLAGGFAGALLGHIVVTACLRAGGENWLRGPYGPHFFDISLYLSFLYGGIAASICSCRSSILTGFLGPWLGIALPMVFLTHFARWGMEAGAQPTLAWYWAVLACHTAATWGTTLALGAVLVPGRRLRAALAAALGSFLGYLILAAFIRLVPSYAQGKWDPASFIPSPLDLLTGLLIGAGIACGIAWAARRPSAPLKQ